MRTIPGAVTSTYPGYRTASLNLSYEQPKPTFTSYNLSDSLGLSDPALFVDLVVNGTDILRVCNFGDTLYTQLVSGLTFGSWVSSGKTLFHNSRPGVDISDVGNRIWYQDPSGSVNYYNYPAGSPVSQTTYSTEVGCAPVGNGCYIQSMDDAWLKIAYVDPATGISIWAGRIYGDLQSPNFIDAVRIGGVDYVFTMDRNAGRTLELQRIGDQWTSPIQVLPLDIVDNTSGFTLAYASVISGKIYVTGRLVRSNDLVPVAMDIFAVGPHPYEFGRYKFLTELAIGGKIFSIGTTIHYVGITKRFSAPSVATFGAVDSSNQWSSAGPGETSISDTERGGSQFSIIIPNGDTAAEGNDVYVDAVINSSTIRLGSYSIGTLDEPRESTGLSRQISGVGKSLSKLERWYPFQSLYLLSQSALSSNPASLSNVLRVTGTYSQNVGGYMQMAELNTPGILYSIARASSSILSRGRFLFPLSYALFPRYGVGANYYGETQAQAALRLGVSTDVVTTGQYGNNGIVALYGSKEFAGAPGIAVYEITNDVYTKLASASLTITPTTLHWIQLQFVDGRIIVSFRYDTDTVWTRMIDTIYVAQDRSPWSDQNDGHGLLYVENKTVYANTVGFSSDSDVIPVDDVSMFSGAPIVQVDQEIILCKTVPATVTPAAGLTNAFQCGGRLGYDSGWGQTGYPVVINGADMVHADGYYVGSCVTATAGTGAGTSFLITYYDAISPSTWITTFLHNPATDDWHDYIDITPSHGHWTTGAHRVCWVSTDPGATFGADTVFSITPALAVQTRGYNSSLATTHGAGKVSLYTEDKIQVDKFETFSGDVDISIMDAFKRVFKMAGAGAPTFSPALLNPTITAPWTSNQWVTNRRNFIADLTIPTLTSGQAIGFSFRHDIIPTGTFAVGPNAATGYMVLLRNSGVGNYVEFWKSSGTNFILQEKIDVLFTPSGVMRFSVQDNTFSIWINETFVHSFQDGPTDVEVLIAQQDIGGVFSAIASFATATTAFVPELCERLPDLPIDTMSNGWSAITTIIAQRRIYFSDTSDGSIYCYQTRPNLGNAPDIVMQWERMANDTAVTRVRAEGVKIAEYANWNDVRAYGDIGMPVNAMYANSAGEVIREARLVQKISVKEAVSHKLLTTFYPGITSGDNWSFLLNGTRKDIQILGTALKFSVANGALICDMELDGIDG